MLIVLEQWGRTCGEEQEESFGMGGGGVSHDGLSLEDALDALGFASVAAFSAWMAIEEPPVVHAVAWQLFDLMTQPAQ